MLKSAALGGLIAGAAVGFPFIGGCLLLLCCIGVMAGGFLAAFFYSKESRAAGTPFRAGGGATVGLLAAPFFAVSSSIVGALSRLIVAPDPEAMMEMFEQWMEPEQLEQMRQGMEAFGGAGFSLIGLLVSMVFMLILGAIFCTIGGLIGGAVFKVEPTDVVDVGTGGPGGAV